MIIHDLTTDHCCCACRNAGGHHAASQVARTCMHGNDPQNCPDCNVW